MLVPLRHVACLLSAVLAATTLAQSNTKPKPPENCEAPENPARGITPPRLISAPDPAYPRGVREEAGPQTVTLSVVVGSNGKACNPQVNDSPGPEFERAALDAIRDWRWKPGSREGKPIAVQITVEMTFQTSRR